MQNSLTPSNDFGSGSGCQLTNQVRSYHLVSAKWAKFLAIPGFIGVGLMVLLELFIGPILKTANSYNSLSFPPFLVTLLYLIAALRFL